MPEIYVDNLSENTTDDSLRQFFEQYGVVLSASITKDSETGCSTRSGYVTFVSEDEANGALRASEEQELDGHRIQIALTGEAGRTEEGVQVAVW